MCVGVCMYIIMYACVRVCSVPSVCVMCVRVCVHAECVWFGGGGGGREDL